MTTTTTPQTSAAVRDNGPGRTVSIVGIVLGALALLFGLLTGIPGLICGIVGAVKGNRLGWVAIVVSVVAMVLSIAIGFAIVGGHH
ncbi:MAG TPA: hypothetical protein VHW92_08985 [Mycobacteriales bacterium]|jgi:hypothetical protein|nr:hypothetical protein [Mycobacteriales bacterium]